MILGGWRAVPASILLEHFNRVMEKLVAEDLVGEELWKARDLKIPRFQYGYRLVLPLVIIHTLIHFKVRIFEGTWASSRVPPANKY